jgi:hypothetical protein
MEKIVKQVELPKELQEVLEVLVELIKVTKEQLKDGFDLSKDLGPILAIAVAKLPLAVDGMDKIGEELKNDLPGTIKASGIFAAELVEIFAKKEEIPAVVVEPQPQA